MNEHTRNRLTIIKTIGHHGPVARTQLPGLTGLSAGTVSGVTAELVARGLIVERRDGSAARGRPRVYLSINAKGAVIAGAAMDGIGTLTVSFTNLTGELLHTCRMNLGSARTQPAMASAVAEAINQAITSSPFSAAEVSRIGIALPAIVDSRSGTMLFMTTFPQEPTPFAGIVAQAVGIPVTIENDMVAMARAEHWLGRAQAMKTFTLISFDFALGSARYVEGMPWSGANGITTDLGHTKISWGNDARSCYCGGRGCASAYASIFGVLQAAGQVSGLVIPPLEELARMFADFIGLAATGDGNALAQLREAGARLGQTVANHINAADPGDVLILMPHPELHALIAEDFQDALEASVMPGMLATARVSFAVVDQDWRWKGTAALALEQACLSGSISRPV